LIAATQASAACYLSPESEQLVPKEALEAVGSFIDGIARRFACFFGGQAHFFEALGFKSFSGGFAEFTSVGDGGTDVAQYLG
jgi:hypothetical protein